MVSCERGFTYVGLLIILAVMGITLAATGTLWSTAAKREREAELLFIGDEFRRAITSYYEGSPGAPRYPAKLEDLVEDNRFPTPKRHLRRIYADPVTGSREWGLVRGPGEVVIGVFSRSQETPLKQGNFPLRYESFEGARSYADWKFVHRSALLLPPGIPVGGRPR